MRIPIGIIFYDKATKEKIFYPIGKPQDKPKEKGKIIKQPNPQEDKIKKEKKKDFPLSAILKKYGKKTLPKNPFR